MTAFSMIITWQRRLFFGVYPAWIYGLRAEDALKIMEASFTG